MRIDQEVLSTLSAARVAGAQVFLTGQLDRGLYMRTNKVLEAAGGKWNRKEKAHVFDGDATERIDQIILTESVDVPKDEFDFFPTPPHVVQAIMDAADVRDRMSVLEPSAGAGNIAKAFLPFAQVDCVEVLEANCEVLRQQGYGSVKCADFLALPTQEFYDRVVMNPPFSKRRDMAHVTHAFKFLKPGGRLVAVMPPSFTFRDDRLAREFRELVASAEGSVEPLPEGSFKASGTMVSTVLVILNKA